MFRGIIMPIIRRTDYVNNCMWSMPGCVGCSRAELGHELCAHAVLYIVCSPDDGHNDAPKHVELT